MHNWSIAILLSWAAGAAWTAGAAAAPPQRVEVGYQLARNGTVVAEVSDRLEHDGKTYRLSETWKGKGVFSLKGEATRSSTGAVAPDGLRPRKFEDKRSGRDTRQHEFDPKSNAPALQRQDRLSFIWNFAFAPPREAVAVTVSDGKGTSNYVYLPAGRERLKTPAGEFDALKLVKKNKEGDGRKTEIWLAADRHYLPVRIAIVEKDGTRIEQVAVKISTR
jgi:hypothetical protein